MKRDMNSILTHDIDNQENQELLPSMSVLSHISSHPEIVAEPHLESDSLVRTSISNQNLSTHKSDDNNNSNDTNMILQLLIILVPITIRLKILLV